MASLYAKMARLRTGGIAESVAQELAEYLLKLVSLLGLRRVP
jgi:hypothetical protein